MIVSGVSQETNVTGVAEASNARKRRDIESDESALQKGHTGRKFDTHLAYPAFKNPASVGNLSKKQVVPAAPHQSGLSKVLPPPQQALRHLLSVQREDQVITPITVNMEIARA